VGKATVKPAWAIDYDQQDFKQQGDLSGKAYVDSSERHYFQEDVLVGIRQFMERAAQGGAHRRPRQFEVDSTAA
jgi:hypothetical protein